MGRKGTPRRVAVIGGGISGVAAAHHLHQRGVEVTLFERESAPGGHAIAHSSDRTGHRQLPMGVSLLQAHYVNLFVFLGGAGVPVRRLSVKASACIDNQDAGFLLRVSKAHPLEGITDPMSRRLRFDAIRMLARSERYLRDRSRGMPETSFREFMNRSGCSEESRYFISSVVGWAVLAIPPEVIDNCPASAIIHYITRQRVLQYPLHNVINFHFSDGGTSAFRQISQDFSVLTNAHVEHVDGDKGGSVVNVDDRDHEFDAVILCSTTGTQSLDLIMKGSSEYERKIVEKFESRGNEINGLSL